jgi:hypothetical protein
MNAPAFAGSVNERNNPGVVFSKTGMKMYGGRPWHYPNADIPVPAPESGERMIL